MAQSLVAGIGTDIDMNRVSIEALTRLVDNYPEVKKEFTETLQSALVSYTPDISLVELLDKYLKEVGGVGGVGYFIAECVNAELGYEGLFYSDYDDKDEDYPQFIIMQSYLAPWEMPEDFRRLDGTTVEKAVQDALKIAYDDNGYADSIYELCLLPPCADYIS